MPLLQSKLALDRCPHCSISKPFIAEQFGHNTSDFTGRNKRIWKMYVCSYCGGMITAASTVEAGEVIEVYPKPEEVDVAIPDPARGFLSQAIESLHAPAGAVMLCASAVDAMLKSKQYKKGSLNERIGLAALDHLITEEMAAWAHEVRLDANDQRHSDEAAPPIDQEVAKKCIEFTKALGEFLFVLPARIQRGRAAQSEKSEKQS